jgi:ABC-type uncharacterized transport system ATPase component
LLGGQAGVEVWHLLQDENSTIAPASYLTLIGSFGSGKHPPECALAGAIATHDTQPLTRAHGQIRRAQEYTRAEGFRDSVGGDNRQDSAG